MTPLIPLTYLNEACFLSGEVDEKKYHMVLKLAQEDLRDILGGEFYEEIESQYPISFSTANATLYEDYIKDYLAWQTYGQYLKFAQSDSTQTGLRDFKDDNSNLIGDVKLYAFEKNVKDTAKKYRDRMVNYLVLSQSRDSTAFPKWNNTCTNPGGLYITGVTRGNQDFIISVNRTQTSNE